MEMNRKQGTGNEKWILKQRGSWQLWCGGSPRSSPISSLQSIGCVTLDMSLNSPELPFSPLTCGPILPTQDYREASTEAEQRQGIKEGPSAQ